jgi:hypothetical protein
VRAEFEVCAGGVRDVAITSAGIRGRHGPGVLTRNPTWESYQ